MLQQNTVSPSSSFHPAPVTGAYKVDIPRAKRIGRVSSEWFSRPDDERYLSLTALHDAVRARADCATARTVETRNLRVEASRDDAKRLAPTVPGRDTPVAHAAVRAGVPFPPTRRSSLGSYKLAYAGP